jgi:hypothetical protein
VRSIVNDPMCESGTIEMGSKMGLSNENAVALDYNVR